MSNQNILSNQKISSDQWGEFFDQFTHDNRGRLIKLEIVNREGGDEILIENAPLWSLVYTPVAQGNNLTLSTGRNTTIVTERDEVTYSHTIHAPKTVWSAEDSDGQIVALEVIDESNAQTIFSLKWLCCMNKPSKLKDLRI